MSLGRASYILKSPLYEGLDEQTRTSALQLLSYARKLMANKGFGEFFREEAICPSEDIAQTALIVVVYAREEKLAMRDAVSAFISSLKRVAGDPADSIDDKDEELEVFVINPFDEDEDVGWKAASQIRGTLAGMLDRREREAFESSNLEDKGQYDYWLGLLRASQMGTKTQRARQPRIKSRIMSREYWESRMAKL